MNDVKDTIDNLSLKLAEINDFIQEAEVSRDKANIVVSGLQSRKKTLEDKLSIQMKLLSAAREKESRIDKILAGLKMELMEAEKFTYCVDKSTKEDFRSHAVGIAPGCYERQPIRYVTYTGHDTFTFQT